MIASKSDITLKYIETQLDSFTHNLDVEWVGDLTEVSKGEHYNVTIVDMSIYAAGILDKVEVYKLNNPKSHLIALTYTNDECIDQLLIGKGVDQVTSTAELSNVIKQNFALAS